MEQTLLLTPHVQVIALQIALSQIVQELTALELLATQLVEPILSVAHLTVPLRTALEQTAHLLTAQPTQPKLLLTLLMILSQNH